MSRKFSHLTYQFNQVTLMWQKEKKLFFFLQGKGESGL
jgi:hypothetical protein